MQRTTGHWPRFQTWELRGQKDVFLLNSAVSERAKSGSWNEALVMMWQLGRMVHQVACNSVIGVCIRRWQLASQLLCVSLESLKVDAVTYTSAIKACKRSLAWRNALQHFHRAGQNSVKIDMILSSAAASCVNDNQTIKRWNQALEILCWPPGLLQPIHPDSFSLSLCITAFRTQRTWQQAISVLAEHGVQRLVPQTTTLNAALGVMGDEHFWQLGLLLMGNLKPKETVQMGFQRDENLSLAYDIATFNALISILGQGPWIAAQQLLQKLKDRRAETNVVTYNAVMAAYDKQELWQQSLCLLWKMPYLPVGRDMFSFNTAMGCQWRISCLLLSDLPLHRLCGDATSCSRCVNSCAVTVAWPRALELLRGVEDVSIVSSDHMLQACHGSRPVWDGNALRGQNKLVVVSAAANACGRASQLDKAEQLLHESRPPDVILFNVVMSSFGSVGRWQNVQAILTQLQSSGLRSQVISCNAAISSCDRGQRWQQGRVLFEEVRRLSMQCTSVTFNAAISASARQGEWRASLWLVEEMQQHLQPNPVTYNTLISACVSGSLWERALACTRILHSFQDCGMQADAISCSSAITSCSESNKWKLAWLFLEDTREKQVPINHVIAGSISSLGKDTVHIFEAHGSWRETSTMLELLCKRQAEANVLALSSVVIACEKGDGHKHLLQSLCAIDNYASKGLQLGGKWTRQGSPGDQ